MSVVEIIEKLKELPIVRDCDDPTDVLDLLKAILEMTSEVDK